MEEAAPSLLTHWESFYVIVGSSAAALTGLMFVVVALVAESESRRRDAASGIDAFGTPTIVHFCSALLVSAVLSAPWASLSKVGILMTLMGTAGVGYTVIVLRRARRQTGYRPELEDWLWHVVFPILSYGALLVAGVLFTQRTVPCLFTIGAVTLMLLFIGIHNSWDTVTWMAIKQATEGREPS